LETNYLWTTLRSENNVRGKMKSRLIREYEMPSAVYKPKF